MQNSRKCPYCSGDGKKVKGRIAGLSSHLTFGYGEHTNRCMSCGEYWSICSPIPPKGHPKMLDVPNPGILNISFREGTSGFAHGGVLKANSAIFIERVEPHPDEDKEKAGEGMSE